MGSVAQAAAVPSPCCSALHQAKFLLPDVQRTALCCLVELSLPLVQEGCLVAMWVTNRERHRRFVEQELLPFWGLHIVATWHWLKVTPAGEAVTPLVSHTEQVLDHRQFAAQGPRPASLCHPTGPADS